MKTTVKSRATEATAKLAGIVRSETNRAPSFYSRFMGKVQWHKLRRRTTPVPDSVIPSGDAPVKASLRTPLDSTSLPSVPDAFAQADTQELEKPLPDIPSILSSKALDNISQNARKDSLSECQSLVSPAPSFSDVAVQANVVARYASVAVQTDTPASTNVETKVDAQEVHALPTPIVVSPPSASASPNRQDGLAPQLFLAPPTKLGGASPHPSPLSEISELSNIFGSELAPPGTPATPASSFRSSAKSPLIKYVKGMQGLPLDFEYHKKTYHFLLGRDPVGFGASGKVYLADSPKSDHRFAVKVIRKKCCLHSDIPITQKTRNLWKAKSPQYIENIQTEIDVLNSCMGDPSLFLVHPEVILQDYEFYYFVMVRRFQPHDALANWNNRSPNIP